MRKSFLLILLTINTFLHSQGKIIQLNDHPYPHWIETISFEVTGINWENGYLAFRHIYKHRSIYSQEKHDFIDPINTNYAGLSAYPGAGVIIGIYHLGNSSYLKTYTIYESVFEISKRTSEADSADLLAEAKDLFRSYNIDWSTSPKLHVNSITRLIKRHPNIIQSIKIQLPNLQLNGETNSSLIYDGNNITNGKLISYISLFSQPIYLSLFSYVAFNVGTADLSIIGAYENNGKVIFLEKYTSQNAGSNGLEINEMYSFSRIIPLKRITQ
ncbi:MAG: hypothetical protein GY756_23730 [bacterium]|nr:hypothetical protein [bacterium]